MQEDLRLPQSEPTALNFIRQRFTAAKGFEDAQYVLTTAQVLQKIVDHTGAIDVQVTDVYNFLKANGFNEETLSSDMTIVWLMKDLY